MTNDRVPANKLSGWTSAPSKNWNFRHGVKVRDEVLELLMHGRFVVLPHAGLDADQVLQELCVQREGNRNLRKQSQLREREK